MGIVNFSPKQDGTGNPSLTNVRPIHPGLVLKSKNLLNPDDVHDGYVKADDSTGSGSQWHYTDYLEVTDEYTYTVSGSIVTGTPAAQFVFYNESKNKISSIHSGPSNFTFIPPTGTKYVRLSLKGDDPFQLELGSTATEYEPYYNMEIYGGDVDFENGELAVTYAIFSFDGTENWTGAYISSPQIATRFTVWLDTLTGENIYGNGWLSYCSHFKYGGTGTTTWGEYRYNPNSNGRAYFCIPDPYLTYFPNGTDEFKGWVSDQSISGTPLQFVVPLTESKSYSLTASQLTQAYNQLVPVSPIMINKRRRMLLSSPHIEIVQSGNSSDSSQIATFKADMSVPIKSLKVNFSPIQEGSGDPSPTNIRPISGYTGLTVKQAGVNLLQCDTFTNGSSQDVSMVGTRNADGEIESISLSGTCTGGNVFRNLSYTTNTFKILDGTYATCSYSSQANIQLGTNNYNYKLDGLYNSLTAPNAGWYTITVGEIQDVTRTYTLARIQGWPYQTGVEFNTTIYPMMCLAQDRGCEFEPYKGIEIPISWQSEAGTLYGGYVNLVTGELIAEWDTVSLNQLNYSLNTVLSGVDRFYTTIPNVVPPADTKDLPNVISDRFKAEAIYDANNKHSVWSVCGNGSTYYFYTPSGEYSSSTEFKNAMEGVQFLCKRRTPIATYQLAPQQIKTLISRNNIWSDAGDVEVKFWTHKYPDTPL